MATGVPAVLEELAAALADIEPAHEGLRDYAELDIQSATKQEVTSVLGQYDRRVDLLQNAKRTLEKLIADGYPDLPVHEVADAIYADLADQERTIAAALAKFSSTGKAATLGLGASPAEPKS